MTFVCDTETSGLDPQKHNLLSVGGVLLDEELNEVGEFHEFMKHPEYCVQPDAMAVNKIDLRWLSANGKTQEQVADKFMQFLHLTDFQISLRSPIVFAGWNVGFDLSFVWENLEPWIKWPFVMRRGGGATGTRTLDIQALAIAVSGDIKPRQIGRAHV